MEELIKLQEELNKTKAELRILYEVSNAMRTTLNLDEILYIILTGLTAHVGLGFNRAMLFLVNEIEGTIEGKMGIGPDTGEEANKIWTYIGKEEIDLDGLINAYKISDRMFDSQFNQQVKHIKVSIKEEASKILTMCALEGMPLHLTKETIRNYSNDPILKILNVEELVAVPLRTKDKVNGIIVADNIFTKKPISKDDIRMLIMLSDQAGLAIENSQLYEQTLVKSHSDSLTELWNHGYFQYMLKSELEKSKATETPLSLVMIDIDDFKKYNDAFGHQIGDQVIKELSKLIKEHSRKIDWVCRYGGEEFTIILPLTNKNEAFIIAEKLRATIADHPFTHEEVMPHKKITVSMGIATFSEDGLTNSELLSAADKFLYKAKYQGKNQTCCRA
ncbi:MAG: sensor domain-containing diguanylate cyclase [Candidatus Omnitrophota bacterium]|nr:sensor domain-containing diguanylate cyclase [Candidatus Omnitrophota bacterium]